MGNRGCALVAGGVNGDDIWQTEVPHQVRVQEGRDEGAACAVHVDAHIPAVLRIQLACNVCVSRSAVTPRWMCVQLHGWHIEYHPCLGTLHSSST